MSVIDVVDVAIVLRLAGPLRITRLHFPSIISTDGLDGAAGSTLIP